MIALAQADWESAPRFAEADQAYLGRADPSRVAFAKERYETLYRADPADWEAGWRVAMTCYYLGGRVAREPSEKEVLFAHGRDVAQASALVKPDCAPCHLLAGINMALYGQSVGVLKMIFTLRDIRGHLRRSLELDPTFAEAAAARTLATIDQVVPFFLGGSKKRALKNYQRALEIDPAEPLNYLFYARFLAKRQEFKTALDLAERGVALPRPGPERVESRDGWDRLQALVPELREGVEEPPKTFRRLKPGQRKKR
jgi:tetratricopeptide (TPR) repeat protein